MPTYTYECREGHRWDESRSMTDPDLNLSDEACPVCPAHPAPVELGRPGGSRVFNPGDFRAVFKGRGWARKDHKDASKP